MSYKLKCEKKPPHRRLHNRRTSLGEYGRRLLDITRDRERGKDRLEQLHATKGWKSIRPFLPGVTRMR